MSSVSENKSFEICEAGSGFTTVSENQWDKLIMYK